MILVHLMFENEFVGAAEVQQIACVHLGKGSFHIATMPMLVIPTQIGTIMTVDLHPDHPIGEVRKYRKTTHTLWSGIQ